MQRLVLTVLALPLAGCDLLAEMAFEIFMNRGTTTVVLSKQPMLLTPERTVLAPREPMMVAGEWTLLCLALRGGTSLGDAEELDRAFNEAMHNTKVSVQLTLSNGSQVALLQPNKAWNMRGKVVEHGELSACASNPCSEQLRVGVQVSRVEISTDQPLQVQGVYWLSERGVNEKPAAPIQTSAASAPKKATSCSA